MAGAALAQESGAKCYDSYKGLVMAGYQGWFNAEGDGASRGFYHYTGKHGFRPGSASIDLWPDVSEYEISYPTEFIMPNGEAGRVFSSEDSSTVDTHFRWMEEYGLDGVFMQRFVCEIKNESGKRHFDKVLSHTMKAAKRHGRAIAIMYDLSGIQGEDCRIVNDDIAELAEKFGLFDRKANPSYLYHNGKPLVAVWGVGFNDGRRYSLEDVSSVVTNLKESGFSVMLGVPTNWRTLDGDTEPDSRLHSLICDSDVIMPWFVGRYDESAYDSFRNLIRKDIKWCKDREVDYAPLVYPGFSWKNMCGPDSFFVPRNNGAFFKKQIDGAIEMGAEMLYVAMFDEIDEGTAIFKCAKTVPLPEEGSAFVPIDPSIDNDLYLRLAGQASARLSNSPKNPKLH